MQRLQEETSGMEGSWQHGFRKGHSTETAAIELQSIIAEALDKGEHAIVYSIDLSAAFDLLRIDVLEEELRGKISSGLSHIIRDFLTDRCAIVEINGVRSQKRLIPLGCVQGSTLGPRLFTLYCGGLKNKLGVQHFVCYADDSYVIITGTNLNETLSQTELISKKHVELLHNLGMKVNTDKSEVVIFNKTPIRAEVTIGTSKIMSKSDMRVLGIIFDEHLKWETQIRSILSKCRSKLSVLRRIKKRFTTDQFLKIVTSQYYSNLYYCSSVWLSTETRWILKRMINSAHYKALRISINDFKNRTSRDTLNNKLKRATPSEWSNYTTASLVIKIMRDKMPEHIHSKLSETIFSTRRKPQVGKFYNNARGKIGKQSIQNRLQHMDRLTENWLHSDWNNDRIRTTLKKTFFQYAK